MGNVFKKIRRISRLLIKKNIRLLIKKRFDYTPLKEEDYYKRFGILKINGKYVVRNKSILEKAYTKAWENRNYEIDKFWTRAAYFWGFIVLIFGGYISLLTSDHSEKAIEVRLDLYLLLLGFLFSLSWYLVILGSKCWQQNWEAHIDRLEDYVSGPIYRTIFYSGDRYYSVSKLNEVMALVVFLVWCILLGQYINSHFTFTLDVFQMDIQATISIFTTLLFAVALRFGYSLGDFKTYKYKFFDRFG
ncbi:MAG TPA: hypothetical protein VK718_09215 [Ferruginibacter sp.]|jgi:hypothetical protein|nr:hypothetical protein [Ferruginibacter sp.]